MIDHGHTLLRFSPARAAELRDPDGEQNVNESIIMHEFASSEVVPLEDATAQICWRSALEGRIAMLG